MNVELSLEEPTGRHQRGSESDEILRWLAFATLLAATVANADSLKVVMNLVTEAGLGKTIGVVTAADTKYGVVL